MKPSQVSHKVPTGELIYITQIYLEYINTSCHYISKQLPGGVCILKIAKMYLFTDALKTPVLLFQNFQTEISY